MKRKKIIPFIALILLLWLHAEAQELPSFYPFKGFHVGVTGQAQFIQKSNFIALTSSDPAPRGIWTYGWDAGIEFSYHFAKYFGIAIGINYGTILSYNSDIYLSTVPDFKGGWKEVNRWEQLLMSPMQNKEIFFPIKFEFHFPMRRYLFFTAEAGIKLKGVLLGYGRNAIGSYVRGSNYTIFPPYTANDKPEHISYYSDYGIRNLSKIYCDLFLGIGLYYKLPYGDLLRFTAGVNMAFHNIIEGYYQYHLTDSYGTFSVKNDFIYTQLSYIHTLKWQKAKKYLKKQEYSFSSKKERREKIFELLEIW